ncbi:hypothetical protein [Cohnella rhizosphaerae]|uniref:Uncharacterized protein n=1 Tax=Cohnella rhizosphaerae TaxID=1457232 RepID=A0A9X4L112_9BACL|nr:hypothetical protein [Cohnella rhizosphaerae]MDG0814592.1 hypothetical protein [Cohnella rhizosphaerae]
MLQLEYWEGCEAVKGKLAGSGISFSDYRILRQPGRLPTVVWHSLDDQTLIFDNQGSTGGIERALDHTPSPTADVTDWSDGRVIEYKVTVREGTGIGVFFGRTAFLSIFKFQAQPPGVGRRQKRLGTAQRT